MWAPTPRANTERPVHGRRCNRTIACSEHRAFEHPVRDVEVLRVFLEGMLQSVARATIRAGSRLADGPNPGQQRRLRGRAERAVLSRVVTRNHPSTSIGVDLRTEVHPRFFAPALASR